MNIDSLLKWLEAFGFATAIREGEVLFPWIEAIHVLAIVLVVGSIATVDLRLLGWASRERAVKVLAEEVLPITWMAFVVAAITGALMFCAKAMTYGHSVFFLLKMGVLLLAGCNMLYFQKVIYPGVRTWGAPGSTVPKAARVAGGLSLLFWFFIVAFGRWIGFTT
ncbi:MAG TPA: DUF6644 family protein [Burkholderiales bacterium]|nr:DUF6644 family protein [Burkholderiales bacterium]